MKKTSLVYPGYCVGLGGLLLITYRTMLAIGSESKAVMIHVNRYGEQYLDLVCLVFLWVVCLVGLWSLTLLMKERKDTTRSHTKNQEADGEEQPAASLAAFEYALQQPLLVWDQPSFRFAWDTDRQYLSSETDGQGNVFSVSVLVN